YALGTLMAAQLFQQIERDLPEITAHIASGNFEPLLEWLRTHIHRWGRRRTAQALLRGATGTELDPAPFLRYIHTKYGALYQGVPASASRPSEA
ncbi:MAG: carboxypeptidase M32, partial [Bacteroidetes bacterium]|nr:carboxypeptidase M32 [Bacteroidota bacterium]